MGEIGGLAAVVGAVVTGLVAVIGYLLADQRGDRKQYEAAIEKAEARADAAEQRSQAAWRLRIKPGLVATPPRTRWPSTGRGG